jgi:hypothetical protein
MAGARQIIDGPVFTNMPYGLWDTVQQRPSGTDPHWRNGVTWQDFCPNTSGSSTYDVCVSVTGTGGGPPAAGLLSSNVVETNRGATPFTVYAEFDCSPVGLDAAGERAQAETALAKVESFEVERAFWTGAAGSQQVVWPHLAANTQLLYANGITLQNAASPVVTGGAGIANAMGSLEYQLSQAYGGQGVVHMPRSVFAAAVAQRLIDFDQAGDGRLYTKSGNLLAVGGGYPGTGPDGSTPASGTAWMYATGACFGYRSDVFVQQSPGNFDRSQNTVRRIAQRTYLFGFECSLMAALVNLPT